MPCPECEQTKKDWTRDFLVICILGLMLMTVLIFFSVSQPERGNYQVKVVKQTPTVCEKPGKENLL